TLALRPVEGPHYLASARLARRSPFGPVGGAYQRRRRGRVCVRGAGGKTLDERRRRTRPPRRPGAATAPWYYRMSQGAFRARPIGRGVTRVRGIRRSGVRNSVAFCRSGLEGTAHVPVPPAGETAAGCLSGWGVPGPPDSPHRSVRRVWWAREGSRGTA